MFDNMSNKVNWLRSSGDGTKANAIEPVVSWSRDKHYRPQLLRNIPCGEGLSVMPLSELLDECAKILLCTFMSLTKTRFVRSQNTREHASIFAHFTGGALARHDAVAM